MIDNLDKLTQLEGILHNIPDAIMADLAAGLDAAGILKKYKSFAAARTVATMLQDNDRGDRAAQALLDRVDGKPTQKQEVTAKYEGLSEDKLDALLKSKLSETEEDLH